MTTRTFRWLPTLLFLLGAVACGGGGDDSCTSLQATNGAPIVLGSDAAGLRAKATFDFATLGPEGSEVMVALKVDGDPVATSYLRSSHPSSGVVATLEYAIGGHETSNAPALLTLSVLELPGAQAQMDGATLELLSCR